jgi:hypothetical protein
MRKFFFIIKMDFGERGCAVMKRVFYVIFVLIFTSCIGIQTEIDVKRDLSGTVRMVYTVSEELLSNGTLDGNENWPALPVGKADFERTVSRIDGLALKAYREKNAGGNRLFEVTLGFDHIAALSRFLDVGGQQLDYANENGSHVITVLFSTNAADSQLLHDDALAALAGAAFSGYQFDFSISVPGGTKTYSAPMADLLASQQPEKLEIRF